MKTIVLAVLIVSVLTLLTSSAFGKALIVIFGGKDTKDAAFMALLFGTVVSLLKVLWEANSKNHNSLKLYTSVVTTLLFPFAAIVMAQRFGFEEQTKAAYMVVTALIGVTLPWVLISSSATMPHQKYLWGLYIVTLAVTGSVFGIFHEIAVNAKTLLTGGMGIYNDGTSSLLIAPLAVGMAATTWAVLQFSPKHHHGKCATLTTDASHWQRIYMITAVILATAYGCLYPPSAIAPVNWTYMEVLRSAVTCSLLLLSPIIAVTIHDRLIGFEKRNTSLILPITGLLIGAICALVVSIILKFTASPLLNKDLIYLVLVHSLVGLLSMISYLWIKQLMLTFPWPWVGNLADALTRSKNS